MGDGGHVPTLPAFLETGARRWPDRVWCRTPDGSATRAQALEAAGRVAAGLADLGVAPGDRVVVVLPNRLEFVYAWFGLALARAITVCP